MPIININLLAQQQTRVSRLTQANVLVAVVAGTIIGLQLLIVVFLYTTIAIRSGEKQSLINETADLQGNIKNLDKDSGSVFYRDMTLTQQAQAYQEQIKGANALIDNHKYFTLYLSEIAINTPRTVVYSTFSSDSTTRLLITGSADSYAEASKLAESFKKLSFAKTANLQDAKLDATRSGRPLSVRFTLVIELKSAAELNKLPSPSGGLAPAPGVSPTPRPTVSPGRASPVPQLPVGS